MFKLEIDLPVPPSVNSMFVNNYKGKGRSRFPSKQYKDWKIEAGMVIRQLPRIPYYEKPVKITYKYFFKTKRLCDLLVSMRVVEDDNWKHVKEYSLMFGGIDKENPRVCVIVEEI